MDIIVLQTLIALPIAGQVLTSGQAQARALVPGQYHFLQLKLGSSPRRWVSLGSLSKRSGKMSIFLYLLLLPAPLHRVPVFWFCFVSVFFFFFFYQNWLLNQLLLGKVQLYKTQITGTLFT